jgi:hypothetical protein
MSYAKNVLLVFNKINEYAEKGDEIHVLITLIFMLC